MRAGRIRPVRLMATAVVAAFLAACSGGDGGTGPDDDNNNNGGGGGGGGTQPVTVSMVDNSFGPTSVTVKAGTTVRWVNNGSTPHTTTSTTGLWDSNNVSAGGNFQRDFDAVGTFPYVCTNHAGMSGTVVVTAN